MTKRQGFPCRPGTFAVAMFKTYRRLKPINMPIMCVRFRTASEFYLQCYYNMLGGKNQWVGKDLKEINWIFF